MVTLASEPYCLQDCVSCKEAAAAAVLQSTRHPIVSLMLKPLIACRTVYYASLLLLLL